MKQLSLLLIAFFCLNPAFAAESAYTKLDLDKDCTWHSEYELGASAYCQGYKGYPVHFSEGDLRQMVRFGYPASLLGQWESFEQFNRISDTIEWRLKNAKPYAAILRMFIENPDDDGNMSKASEGQVLVVSKVASHEFPTSCVIGYVDAKANRNANELARQIADELAFSFKCTEDKAQYKGNVGPYAGTPVSYFE